MRDEPEKQAERWILTWLLVIVRGLPEIKINRQITGLFSNFSSRETKVLWRSSDWTARFLFQTLITCPITGGQDLKEPDEIIEETCVLGGFTASSSSFFCAKPKITLVRTNLKEMSSSFDMKSISEHVGGSRRFPLLFYSPFSSSAPFYPASWRFSPLPDFWPSFPAASLLYHSLKVSIMRLRSCSSSLPAAAARAGLLWLLLRHAGSWSLSPLRINAWLLCRLILFYFMKLNSK